MLKDMVRWLLTGRRRVVVDMPTGRPPTGAVGTPARMGWGEGPAAAPTGRPGPLQRLLGGQAEAFDDRLLWIVLSLLALGVVMIYSASIAVAARKGVGGGEETYYLIRQLIALGVALPLAMAAFAIPPYQWQRLARPLYFTVVLMLILVFVPGIGRSAGGASRWVMVGPISVQPTEVMKLAIILYVADYARRKQGVIQTFREGFFPMAVTIIVSGMLIAYEPDLGALIVITCTAGALLFIGGMSARLFLGMGAMMLTTFAALVTFESFRLRRLLAYLDPFDPEIRKAAGYQLSHSLMAIGKGDMFGAGLGAGVAKLYYLPEPHTDFLFAIIGEELGMVGMLTVVLLFFLVVRSCVRIGREALEYDRIFEGLVAQGVGIWIGLQAFIHVGVNTGLLPTKGLTLPLMSYGSNSLVMTCVAIALVLRIDFENRRSMRGVVQRRARR